MKSRPYGKPFVFDIESKLHNNNVKYKAQEGYCILNDGHWKVTFCDYDRDVFWSDEKPKCPSDVGSKWRREDYLDNGISVICLE